MDRYFKIKKCLVFFALAWILLPAYAYAARHYFLFLKYLGEPTEEQLERAAHFVFRNGVLADHPQTFGGDTALNFYNWLTTNDDNNFVTMYSTMQMAEADLRRLGPMNGLLVGVSADERVFNFLLTMNNLRLVIPNQAGRDIINRFITDVIIDVPEGLVVGAMPSRSGVVDPTTIRGSNIYGAQVYLNDVPMRWVSRNDEDGPFVEGTAERIRRGYRFPGATTLFPVDTSVSVSPGTDNVTFIEGCGPSTAFRPIQPARPDRNALRENTCKTSEMINFDEFGRRHRRHRGFIIPLQALLFH